MCPDNIRNGNEDSMIKNADDNQSPIVLNKSTFYKLVIIGVIGLMAAAFFGGYSLHSYLYQSTPVYIPTNLPTETTTASNRPVTITNITVDGSHTLGPLEAEIVVVEFSDFQCSFCQSFFSNTLSQLKNEYVDTGRIKFVYKHFPFDFHQNARPAAVASECAGEQGRFWDYHDILMINQTSWENLGGNDTINAFVNFAERLGLDKNNFKSCLETMKYENKIEFDMRQGYTIGVTGTPAFFVGIQGKEFTSINGAQPFSSFKQAIDEML